MKTAALLILFLILGMGAGALLFTAINPSYELGLALAALLATAAAGVVLVTLWQLKGK